MGVERAREAAERGLRMAKAYPADHWSAISLRETALEMLEVVQSYEAAERRRQLAAGSRQWGSRGAAKEFSQGVSPGEAEPPSYSPAARATVHLT